MRTILTFNHYISPKLMRAIYWVGLGCIAFMSLAGIYNSLTFSGDLTFGAPQSGFFSLISVLIGTVLAVIVWRLAVEMILVLFSIHELLRDIKNQNPTPPPVYNRRSTDVGRSA